MSHGCLSGALRSNRIDHFEKREPTEISIPCANSPDPVLAHKYGGVRVMEQIASQVWQLRNDFSGDVDVSVRRDKKTKARRGKKCGDKLPCPRRTPWPSHHARVGCHAQKFVKNRPRGVPGIRSCSLSLKPITAGRMKLRVGVSCVYKDVGVDGEHYRPSMA